MVIIPCGVHYVQGRERTYAGQIFTCFACRIAGSYGRNDHGV